jgi:hypothetical protein
MKSFAFSVNQDWEAARRSVRAAVPRGEAIWGAFAVLPSQLNKTGSSPRGAGRPRN